MMFPPLGLPQDQQTYLENGPKVETSSQQNKCIWSQSVWHLLPPIKSIASDQHLIIILGVHYFYILEDKSHNIDEHIL